MHIHFYVHVHVHVTEALGTIRVILSAGRLPYDFINSLVIAFSDDQLSYRNGYLSVTPTPGDQPCRSSYRETRKREQGFTKVTYARETFIDLRFFLFSNPYNSTT